MSKLPVKLSAGPRLQSPPAQKKSYKLNEWILNHTVPIVTFDFIDNHTSERTVIGLMEIHATRLLTWWWLGDSLSPLKTSSLSAHISALQYSFHLKLIYFARLENEGWWCLSLNLVWFIIILPCTTAVAQAKCHAYLILICTAHFAPTVRPQVSQNFGFSAVILVGTPDSTFTWATSVCGHYDPTPNHYQCALDKHWKWVLMHPKNLPQNRCHGRFRQPIQALFG